MLTTLPTANSTAIISSERTHSLRCFQAKSKLQRRIEQLETELHNIKPAGKQIEHAASVSIQDDLTQSKAAMADFDSDTGLSDELKQLQNQLIDLEKKRSSQKQAPEKQAPEKRVPEKRAPEKRATEKRAPERHERQQAPERYERQQAPERHERQQAPERYERTNAPEMYAPRTAAAARTAAAGRYTYAPEMAAGGTQRTTAAPTTTTGRHTYKQQDAGTGGADVYRPMHKGTRPTQITGFGPRMGIRGAQYNPHRAAHGGMWAA